MYVLRRHENKRYTWASSRIQFMYLLNNLSWQIQCFQTNWMKFTENKAINWIMYRNTKESDFICKNWNFHYVHLSLFFFFIPYFKVISSQLIAFGQFKWISWIANKKVDNFFCGSFNWCWRVGPECIIRDQSEAIA